MDIFIAGAGPVGLTLAIELTRYGIPVRVIDKALQRTDKSKALVVWSRTLELLERCGLSAEFVRLGLRARGARFMTHGRQIGGADTAGLPTDYPFPLMIPQSETERLLEEKLNSLGVKVERGVELIDFAPVGEKVAGVLKRADGRTESFVADFLAGCDGAHSFVRHHLGFEFAGDTLKTNFLLADVAVAGEVPRDSVLTYWHEDGILVLFPFADGRFRVVTMADASAPERHDPTLEEVQRLVDRRGPKGLKLSDPRWLAGFSVNERKVRDYYRGQVILLGDAAHIHSPAGGQGMNTGMQDAFNLSWKLALIGQGYKKRVLLDSYSEERSAVGERTLNAAKTLTRLAVMQNRLGQRVRNAIAHFAFSFKFVQTKLMRQMTELAVHYDEGILIGEGAGQRERGLFGVAPLFTLFTDDIDEGIELQKRFPALLELRPAVGEDLLLVRPDGYLACRGDWDDIRAFLHRL